MFIIGLFFTVICSVEAQRISENAIGLRIGESDGFGTEVNYQRAIFDNNRLEFGLGWRNGNGFNAFRLTGLYDWVWVIDGNFNWYAGFGASLGTFSLDDDFGGGIEYNFDFPLLLSLDFRPEIGLINDIDDDLEFDIALGIRYQF